MTVRLVGEGPAIDAVAAALSDVDVRVERGGLGGLADATIGVVSATAGDAAFERANEVVGDDASAIDRWIGIEVGGIGGVPLADIDAAVSGFSASGPCYRCLQQRVAAGGPEPAEGPRADRSAVRLAGAIAGREVVRALAGEDRISGRVLEVPHVERELLPVPGCECAGGTIRSDTEGVPRTVADRPLEETVGAMDRAIDPRVGIVAEIGEAESFPAPYYLATLADTTGFSDGDAPRQAAGVADDWNAALAKGVGEALERYGGACYRDEQFRRDPPAAIGNAVPPAAFAGAGDDAPDSASDREIPWVRGEVLAGSKIAEADGNGDGGDDADAWLPAAAVHFPGPEPRVVPSITTGLGLESSGVGALLAGLTETIERDATMLAWYSTFEPLGLTVEDEAFERLARRARSEDLEVTPLLVTQDVDVPVVSVAVHREDPWPRFAVGSAAALDPTDAATGALEEAIQNWMELRSIGPEQAKEREDAIGHFADLPDSAREFVDVEPAVAASDVGPTDPPEGEAALEAVVEAVEDAGLDAYAARLTTRDLEALGFEAVRVLVPAAQPLFTGTARFGERAESVPESLGFGARLNREHHPYP